MRHFGFKTPHLWFFSVRMKLASLLSRHVNDSTGNEYFHCLHRRVFKLFHLTRMKPCDFLSKDGCASLLIGLRGGDYLEVSVYICSINFFLVHN